MRAALLVFCGLCVAGIGCSLGRVRAGAGAFPEAYRKIKAINVGLLSATEAEAQELEMGKNECALDGG